MGPTAVRPQAKLSDGEPHVLKKKADGPRSAGECCMLLTTAVYPSANSPLSCPFVLPDLSSTCRFHFWHPSCT
jgi:hypothetical protein